MEDGEPVALLLTVSVADAQPLAVLNYLSDLLLANKAERLLKADAAGVLALLTSEVAEESSVLSAEFVIRNEHGLHARPGTALVNVIKVSTVTSPSPTWTAAVSRPTGAA